MRDGHTKEKTAPEGTVVYQWVDRLLHRESGGGVTHRVSVTPRKLQSLEVIYQRIPQSMFIYHITQRGAL